MAGCLWRVKRISLLGLAGYHCPLFLFHKGIILPIYGEVIFSYPFVQIRMGGNKREGNIFWSNVGILYVCLFLELAHLRFYLFRNASGTTLDFPP